jgi:hypothetical protein
MDGRQLLTVGHRGGMRPGQHKRDIAVCNMSMELSVWFGISYCASRALG